VKNKKSGEGEKPRKSHVKGRLVIPSQIKMNKDVSGLKRTSRVRKFTLRKPTPNATKTDNRGRINKKRRGKQSS
jgi:hypothetical protein